MLVIDRKRVQPSTYGRCHRCDAKVGEHHHPTCKDRSSFFDREAYDRGWEASRVQGREQPEEHSPAYLAGFAIGVYAREEADNVSWSDYYG